MANILITSLFQQITGELKSDRGCGAAGLAQLVAMAGHIPVFFVKKVTPARKKLESQIGCRFVTDLDQMEIDRVILYATSLNLFGGKFDDFNCRTIDGVARMNKPIEYFIEDGRKSCSWEGPISGMERLLDHKCYAHGSQYGPPSKASVEFFMNLKHPPVIFPRDPYDYKQWASIYPWHDPNVPCRWMPNYETRIDLWARKFELYNDGYKYEEAKFDLSYVGSWRDGERVAAIHRFGDGCKMKVGGTCFKDQSNPNVFEHPRRVSDKELASFLRKGRGQLITGNDYLHHMQPVHRYLQALVCGNVPFIDSKWDHNQKCVSDPVLREFLYVSDGNQVRRKLDSFDPESIRTHLRMEWESLYDDNIQTFLNSVHSQFDATV